MKKRSYRHAADRGHCNGGEPRIKQIVVISIVVVSRLRRRRQMLEVAKRGGPIQEA